MKWNLYNIINFCEGNAFQLKRDINGWQLAKMKKSIPDMAHVPAMKFIGMKQLV